MKNKIYAIAILVLSSLITYGQAPNWQWAKSVGGAFPEEGRSVCTDANGNVLVTGYFGTSSITFGTTTLTNAGSMDIFIVKYDASGNVLWAKSAGGPSYDHGFDICTDANGNVLLTGYFGGPSITFGTTTLTSAGGRDIYIVKFDPSGNVLWAKSAGGAADDYGAELTTDGNGNLLLTGVFASAYLTFGTTTLTNAGSEDIFVAKYDASGNVLWAKSAGGNQLEQSRGIACDVNGNVLVTGNFGSASITFGTITITSAGSPDIFIAKYDASGNILWAKSEGGNLSDNGEGIVTDASGNIMVTGSFQSDSITFGTTTFINGGPPHIDVFIVKYDVSGNVLWAKSGKGIYDEFCEGMTLDANGNVLVIGRFTSPTITFGTTILTNLGIAYSADIFIVKYDASGNIMWTKLEGGSHNDEGYGIFTDVIGNTVITGSFASTSINFGTTLLTNSTGSRDFFIAKMGSTTGMTDINENYIRTVIYPNPATNHLTITLPQLSQKVNVTISDITGKIICNNSDVSTQKIEVNTKDFSGGVYFVRIQTADFVETRKLIIQK